MSLVSYRAVSFSYPGRGPVALQDVHLEVTEGEVVLVVGPSGGGKSTLLRAANGIVPHATGGTFGGEVAVAGRSTRTHPPREMADIVGFVHQDPEAHFVVDNVEADIAFVLENLGMQPVAMRRRVEEVLDALGIAHLRDRVPATLSGGERQRCAIAGALAAGPRALVLDEPTSQLDPQGADDVLGALARLNADLGTTVIVAEHRLDRAAPLAHAAVRVEQGRVASAGPVASVLGEYAGAPIVTRLGRALGWADLPLTVREARRLAAGDPRMTALGAAVSAPPAMPAPGPLLLRARGVVAELDRRPVLRDADVDVAAGETIAVLGRNGAGKTTLLRVLAGLLPVVRGDVTRPSGARPAYVPQDPSAVLVAGTVRAEVGDTLRLLKVKDHGHRVDDWLDRLGVRHLADRHPRDLAGGERQRVAIAAMAVGAPDVLLLDEPTRGMDPASMAALETVINAHAAGGGAVVLATHDVELAARVATRVIVLGDGEVVAAGPARSVLAGSLFAPQVMRVAPPFLTVAEVTAALAAGAPA